MSKKVKSNKKRRVCRFTGCEQILSMYNSDTHCHVHQQAAMLKEPSSVPIGR